MAMDENIKAPVLDDIDYSASAKKGAPKGVSAPVLDDMSNDYIKNNRKGAPTGVSAPVLDDMSSSLIYILFLGGLSCLVNNLKSVDLPTPVGPFIIIKSPFLKLKLTFFNIILSLNL